jgi:tetratricopeptide (TPR) repeat protein
MTMDALGFLAAIRGQGVPAYPPGVPKKEAIYAAGHLLLSQERYADAAKVFRAMLAEDPKDERGWLALGECHERIGQNRIALELYGTGSVLAEASVRCHLARARALRLLDRDTEADDAMETADRVANERDDEDLSALVTREKGRKAS